jgi:hypothetical protein
MSQKFNGHSSTWTGSHGHKQRKAGYYEKRSTLPIEDEISQGIAAKAGYLATLKKFKSQAKRALELMEANEIGKASFIIEQAYKELQEIKEERASGRPRLP